MEIAAETRMIKFQYFGINGLAVKFKVFVASISARRVERAILYGNTAEVPDRR